MVKICAKENKQWKCIGECDDKRSFTEKLREGEFNEFDQVAVKYGDSFDIYTNLNGAWTKASSGQLDKDLKSICESYDEMKNNEDMNLILDRIYFRNAEKKFKEENRLDEASEVGLFWVDVEDNYKVYGDGVPIRDGEMFGRGTKHQFTVHPSDHYTLWNTIRKENENWKRIPDYEVTPRGRVIFKYEVDNNHFVVYASPLLDNDKCRENICDFFNLPRSSTVFFYDDPHYVPVDQYREEDF